MSLKIPSDVCLLQKKGVTGRAQALMQKVTSSIPCEQILVNLI